MQRYLKPLMPSHYLVVPDLNSEFKPEVFTVSTEALARAVVYLGRQWNTPQLLTPSLPVGWRRKSKKIRWGETKTV